MTARPLDRHRHLQLDRAHRRVPRFGWRGRFLLWIARRLSLTMPRPTARAAQSEAALACRQDHRCRVEPRLRPRQQHRHPASTAGFVLVLNPDTELRPGAIDAPAGGTRVQTRCRGRRSPSGRRTGACGAVVRLDDWAVCRAASEAARPRQRPRTATDTRLCGTADAPGARG